METRWMKMGKAEEAEEGYAEAIRLLLDGQNVAFPTETVYGLGGYIGTEEGLLGIFRAKGRPADNPLIVHVYPGYDISQVAREVPASAESLMARYWPGPMTLILKKAEDTFSTDHGGAGYRGSTHAQSSGGIGTDASWTDCDRGAQCESVWTAQSYVGGACL